jgi:peptidoglycan/xylan/chitin deacetylase (PgdA/CDA1 family)
MTRRIVVALAFAGILCGTAAGNAADCPGNPNALGTSRVIAVDPAEHARLGTMQYSETLPLADHEVVITFDDGPLPPYSTRALDILAHECVKATYFLVGSMARAYPDVARRIYAEGHTIGTHSQNHPMIFNRMSIDRVQSEVENGINSVKAAIGNPKAVAPFFRIPGLARTNEVESYLHGQGLMTWSADFPADDWKHIQASEIIKRALNRIEAKDRGILLLHDIQPATVLALPTLLRELKARGYRIVHIVPAGVDRQKTATAPQDWMAIHRRLGKQGWPRVAIAKAATVQALTAPPAAPALAAPSVVPASTTTGPEQALRETPPEATSEAKIDGLSEAKPEAKTEAKSEPKFDTKSGGKPHNAMAQPDGLSATQSITLPRSKGKFRISRVSRPLPTYVPQIFLHPLVLSN